MNTDEIREKLDDLQMSLPQWCSDGDYAITIYNEMRSVADTLIARVEVLEAERAWLPIETMPIGQDCLVYCRGGVEVRYRPIDRPNMLYPGGSSLAGASGWQHLPAPPTTKEIE